MKVSIGIAIVAIAAALGAAAVGHRAAAKARARFAAAESRRDGLAGEWHALQARVAVRKGPVRGRKAPPAVAAKEADFQANNPIVRAAYIRFFDARLRAQRRFVYHDLGLGPAQIEKIEALETLHEEDRLDRAAAAQAQGLSLQDPGVAAMQKQADAQLALAEAEILGQAGYQQLQQADRAKSAENLGDDVSRLVAYDGTPLTLSQGGQLLNVFLASASSYQSGAPITADTVDRGTMLAQSRAFLSPAQFAALESDTEVVPIMTLVKQFYGK